MTLSQMALASLMLDINTYPLPVCLLLLDNLLGYRVQPHLTCPVSGFHPQGLGHWVEPASDYVACPAAINSSDSIVTSGEAGWTVRGRLLYHALGISQVWASGPDLRHGQRPGLQLHLDHPEPGPPKGLDQGPEPNNYHCACKVAGCPWA